MKFPEESIVRAKDIAKLYKQRSKSQLGRAKLLFDNAFLEVHYGYKDSIKQGKLGLFLHEIKETAECLSLAGAHYLIAREADLKPKIYWALDMMDVAEGESPVKGRVDHAFISVMIKGKEHLLDIHYDAAGKILSHRNGSIIYAKDNDKENNGVVERTYSSIKELTEKEYLEMMNEVRKPGGAIHTLASGQKIYTDKGPIHISYEPEDRIFTAFTAQGVYEDILDTNPISKRFVVEMNTPVGKNGKLFMNDADLKLFYVQGVGWRKDQHNIPHEIVKCSLDDARKYIQNLETAAKFFGRKTSLQRSQIHDKQVYFNKIGFNWTGEIIKENGVDVDKHNALLNKIAQSAKNLEGVTPEIINRMKRAATYRNLRHERTNPDNPLGLIYSDSQREKFVRENIEENKAFYLGQVTRFVENDYAEAGLIRKSINETKENYRRYMSVNTTPRMLVNNLALRIKAPATFNYMIDSTLFKLDNPLETIEEPTEEVMNNYFLGNVHNHMIYSFKEINLIEMKSYKKGLERILSIV